MKRIKQLSKHLINQIAAGEVIERPVSVVKELVENSIDAGATKVSIDITNECRNIRVADNGSGIHPDDIMLAFSKHATSKIYESDDLYDINTLGFRGEALSSIISISKLSCTTRTKDFETGVKVHCENSEVKQCETGCAVGTIMDIRDLFYNIPARLKFLKSSSTEFSYIQEFVQHIAIINPNCSIELKNNGKTVLKTSGQGNLLQAIREVYSPDVAKHLKEVGKTDKLSGLKISGYVSTPDYTRSGKKGYHMYINSRSVKCPVFQKAIDTAYKNLTANGKYPFVVLNLQIPSSDVDVNVHPTKKEVRYKNTNQVFNFIYTSIQGGLSNYVERQVEVKEPVQQAEQAAPSKIVNFFDKRAEKSQDIIVEKDEDTVYVSNIGMQNLQKEVQKFVEQQQMIEIEDIPKQPEDNIIGQYKNTYILIETDDGLEIVDQHIAEERYKYEKLLDEKKVVSQMLFLSDKIPVSSSQAQLIKENLDKFEKYGYGIEFTDENEIVFRKIPQLISKTDPKEILSDILNNIEGDISGLEEQILKTTACKASVKAGQKLSTWQMQEIIKNWRTTKMPYTCPHGRPITHTILHKDIAAFFARTK
ncbi:DNA mismatch repair endonuclease MutL [bacterium]|nr:DNA mismatch repair endonuclease MutL [bacterium]